MRLGEAWIGLGDWDRRFDDSLGLFRRFGAAPAGKNCRDPQAARNIRQLPPPGPE
jgi:hypothetical protein